MDPGTPGQIESRTLAAIASANTPQQLDALRVETLGKKGSVSLMMRNLPTMQPSQRKTAGQKLNALRDRIVAAIDSRMTDIRQQQRHADLVRQTCDMSLPVRPETTGCLHPAMRVQDELVAIFASLGFQTVTGPDTEDDFHNFSALNFSPSHPARDPSDTFFIGGNDAIDGNHRHGQMLLRTHTSPVQVRTMMSRTPPIRIVVPGRVYRRDWDATHTPMFHQIEGLVIDQSSHMGHLRSCLDTMLETFFDRDIDSRFRPHFFPFTEPSAEMDIRCARDGDSVRVGQGEQWMEILGCGMVHPNVLRACSLDPHRYQGYAFGIGVDRLAMLKYAMADLRAFFTGDLQWSRAYGFSPFSG